LESNLTKISSKGNGNSKPRFAKKGGGLGLGLGFGMEIQNGEGTSIYPSLIPFIFGLDQRPDSD
jgi:hypothetical protein